MIQAAEETYQTILDISDETNISVMAIIQYLQWDMIESMEDWDGLSDYQCEALIEACDQRIHRNYIREWRVIYMSNRVINSLFRNMDTSSLEGILAEARAAGVEREDILNRVYKILTRHSDTETERRKSVREMFLIYIQREHNLNFLTIRSRLMAPLVLWIRECPLVSSCPLARPV